MGINKISDIPLSKASIMVSREQFSLINNTGRLLYISCFLSCFIRLMACGSLLSQCTISAFGENPSSIFIVSSIEQDFILSKLLKRTSFCEI